MSPGTFGRYKLLEQLAVGGMAEIWLAVQPGPAGYSKQLVLKRILPHLARDPDFVQMFLDEARLAAQLSHPHIAQIIDFGEVDGAYYLAIELVRGPDLCRLLRACARAGVSVPVPIALRIMAQTCSALHFAHGARDAEGALLQVIHRDVSPQNILVAVDGNARLVDFGIARAASKSHHTESGFVKGKFNYMAPEQLAGGAIDVRTDLFAVGLVLYELVTGKQAYEGESQSVIGRVLAAQVAPVQTQREGLPAEVCAVIDRALKKDPAARYPDAATLEADLERCLVAMGEPTTAHDVARFLESVSATSGDLLHIPGDRTARDQAVAAGKGLSTAGSGAQQAIAPGIDSESTKLQPSVSPSPASARGGGDAAKFDPQRNVATVHMPRPLPARGDSGEASTAIRRPRAPASRLPRVAQGAALGTRELDDTIQTSFEEAGLAPKRPLARALGLAAFVAVVGGLAWALLGNSAEEGEASTTSAAPLGMQLLGAPSPPLAVAAPPVAAPPAADLGSIPAEPPSTAEPHAHPGSEAPPEPTPKVVEPASPEPEPLPDSAPAGGTRKEAHRPAVAVRPDAHRGEREEKPAAAGGQQTEPSAPVAAEPSAAASSEPGVLSISSQPWTNVEVDGRGLGTTPLLRQQLAPGRHQVKLTNPELGLDRDLTIEIASGEEHKEVVRFGKAQITFLALPWAQIRLGKRALGQTPLPPLELYEGIYELKASNPETGKEITRTLLVEPGKDATVKLDLRGGL